MARTGNVGRLSGRTRKLVVAVAILALLALPIGYVVASDTFSDVPTSAFYHDSVNAIAEAGITAGCGDGTRYCPNNAVTRGQMAVFLDRLGNLRGEKGPVVDALLVDGQIVFTGVEDFTLAGGAATECETSVNGHPPESVLPYSLIHQLFDVPGVTVPALVNVQVEDPDREDGDYQVCFANLDETNLTAGTYRTHFTLSAFVGAPFATSAKANLPARWTNK